MFQSGDVWCSGWTGGAAEEARPALNFWTPSRLFYQCKLSLKLLRFRHSQDSSSAMYVPDADISCKMSPFKHSTYTNQQMFLCLWCPSKIIQCCRQISWYISDDYPKTTMKIQLNSQMPKESKHLKAQACYNISSPHSSGPFSENTSNRSLSRCPLSKARTPLPSVSQMWVPAMAHNASKDPQEYNN